MIDEAEFDRWFATATDAAANARAQVGLQAYHWSCFLAEQAAQFAAKALLHGLGQGAWGHDLTELGGKVAHALADDLPDEVDDALRRLSRHYIATRYPDAHPGGTPGSHYGLTDAEQALTDMAAVLDFVHRQWATLRAALEGQPDEA